MVELTGSHTIERSGLGAFLHKAECNRIDEEEMNDWT